MTAMVFVFGSNLAGRHGKGAALAARRHHGAVYGIGPLFATAPANCHLPAEWAPFAGVGSSIDIEVSENLRP